MVLAMVGVIPVLLPRPNGTNLHTCEHKLVNKLSTSQSYQSTDKGYGGMVEDMTLYALCCKTPCTTRPDLGPHRLIDPANNTTGHADEIVQYNFKREVYNS